MATDVLYNGVVLHNVLTRQWDQEIVYDESRCDKVYNKYHLRFECIYHEQAAVANPPAWIGMGNSPGGDWLNVKAALEEPRKVLAVEVGGKSMLYVDPCTETESGYADLDNGPRPLHVHIEKFVGSNLLKVSFEIECCQNSCETANGPDVVLSNRWSVNETIDENWYTTRTIRGRLRISTPDNAGHSRAIGVRNIVVPSLEVGFKRQSIEFIVSANGLDAEYSVVDRQVHTSAPFPATTFSGTHSENTNDGVTWNTDVSVHLEGPPGTNKQQLFAMAARIVQTRLDFNTINSTVSQLQNARFVDYMGDKAAVDVSLSVTHGAVAEKDKEGKGFLTALGNLAFGKLGTKLELVLQETWTYGQYDWTKSQPTPIWGMSATGEKIIEPTAGLLAVQCFLQDPCSGHHIITKTGPTTLPGASENPNPPINVAGYMSPEGLPEETTYIAHSESAKIACYTMARAESRYIVPATKVQMPLGVNTTSGDTSVVCQLAGSNMAYREIVVDCERNGQWPEIPNPMESYKDGELTGTLLTWNVKPNPPATDAAAQRKMFRTTAFYRYALSRAPTLTDTLRVGVLPFTKWTQAEVALKLADCTPAALNPGDDP